MMLKSLAIKLTALQSLHQRAVLLAVLGQAQGGVLLCCIVTLLTGCLRPVWAADASTNPVPLEVGVDARVELLSILFRLAGNPEYSQGKIPAYNEAINRHFAPVRTHPAVLMARQLRNSRGASFDAPMSLAIHLKDVDSLAERLNFDASPPNLDRRWQLDETRQFLEEARRFARDSKFAEFYQAHEQLYGNTSRQARELLEREGRLDWFGRFFGARPGAKFFLVPAFVNGPSNYGPQIKTDTGEELYCILGVWRTDTNGQPVVDKEVLDTVAHEFCHSFVNPHVYARTRELAPAGQQLFASVRERMSRMAYGNWQTVMHESIVRASVVRYVDATQGRGAATLQVLNERQRGFVWTLELSQLLEQYENQRDRYPDFAAFMPRITEFFSDYTAKMAGQPAAPSGESDRHPAPVTATQTAVRATNGLFRVPFPIYWPLTSATNANDGNVKPLLRGTLVGVAAGNKLAITLNLARPADDRQRRLWNSSMLFPQHTWMAEVQVWDANETWVWPNLVYLMRAHGRDREERYGGWDPGKQIDNDFGAVLIRTYDATGKMESTNTLNAPLVSAHWHPVGVSKHDKTTIVHEIRSDQFVVPLSDTADQPAQGREKIWLIYADLLGYATPPGWPKEPEFNGGILAFFSLSWHLQPGQPTEITIEHQPPDSSTGFDWKTWLGRDKQADPVKAPARLK